MEILKASDIAAMIDHSLLHPTMSEQTVIDGCRIAMDYQTATVCVKPCDVPVAVRILSGSPVLVTTVIGFPHGCHTTETKVFEARQAIGQGCRELDMVLNIGRLLGGDETYVSEDIRAVCDVAHAEDVRVKVILENAYLTPQLIAAACRIAAEAGADFVKTSTGYAPSGARLGDLRLMRKSVPDHVQIKAAGGIRTLDAALRVRAVGASRFGATATETIMTEAIAREKNRSLFQPDDDGKEL